MIINHETPDTATLKAAGLYNPITGRKMVKTWMADDLFCHLEDRYRSLEVKLGSQFLYPMPMYRPYHSEGTGNEWKSKSGVLKDLEPYLISIQKKSLYDGINDELGGIILRKTGYVDLFSFVSATRNYFTGKKVYRAEVFDHEQLIIDNGLVLYKDLEASKIIFCEGPNDSNPYWRGLPFRRIRGELFDVKCSITSKHIINRGVYMIPKNGYCTVGSTYDHQVLSFVPQENGINELIDRFKKLYDGDFVITNERAGIRPATYDRRPFIGRHKEFSELGIFNGFGTKGVSLIPYFASKYADCLLTGGKPETEVNVERVY